MNSRPLIIWTQHANHIKRRIQKNTYLITRLATSDLSKTLPFKIEKLNNAAEKDLYLAIATYQIANRGSSARVSWYSESEQKFMGLWCGLLVPPVMENFSIAIL